jgi:hypothetical protein
MPVARRAALVLAALALASVPAASALPRAAAPDSPQNLRGFLLRADEPVTHVFPRTPSFAWAPVTGTACYEFELSTSRGFGENALVWSNVRYDVAAPAAPAAGPSGAPASGAPASSATVPEACRPDTPVAGAAPSASERQILKTPAVAIEVALPWFTGVPYALYAHVRAISRDGPSAWSDSFAFNMRWPTLPADANSPYAGLVRWTQVEGATGYNVWLVDAGKVFSTNTNVADTREYYAFHQSPVWTATVRWRVRAVRHVYGEIPNGLPAVSYGPWSATYTHTDPAFATGAMTLSAAVSDRISTASGPSAHELMPGFSFSGNATVGGSGGGLYRVYVFTDSDCVNMVYKGAAVGGPAYAPRTSGPLKLPATSLELVAAGGKYVKDGLNEGETYTVDGLKITTTEAPAVVAGPAPSGGGAAPAAPTAATVDLPDTDFPETRYYWTVVPVIWVLNAESNVIEYHDIELPQDACAASRVGSFGKQSQPVVTVAGTPYVSGLSPGGRLVAAAASRPAVYGTPLVAWKPATGADAYEVQWSRTGYPWKAKGTKTTFATSAMLTLEPGVWYYRVRGLNYAQAKKPQMSWSAPVAIEVAKPTFKILPK